MRLSPLELAAIDELRSKPAGLTQLERTLIEVIAESNGVNTGRPMSLAPPDAGLPNFEYLTPRENEVLRLVLGGATNRSAGERLGISPRTVELHRSRIIKKFHARSTVDLIRIVMEKAVELAGTGGDRAPPAHGARRA